MKKLFVFLFMLVAAVGYSQTASTTTFGITASGSAVPIACENDGRVKTSQTGAYTNGSADAQALLDPDNNVYVNMAKDSRFKAVKTTSNHLASDTPQTVTLIANAYAVTFVLSETGKSMWVKIGANDAGVDSGTYVTSSLGIENCATDTVISYYASPSVKFSLVQE
jgi:hypothetical protein